MLEHEEVVDPAEKRKKTMAETALELAMDLYDFCLTEAGDVVAIRRSGINVALPFYGRGKTLKSDLFLETRKRRGVILTDKAFKEVATILEADASNQGVVEVPIRIAKSGSKITYDLGSAEGTAIEITPQGWSEIERSETAFMRTVLTKPQISPIRGGDFRKIFNLINIPDEKRDLFLGALVSAFIPEIAHPIVGVDGEQGSGKSFACEILVDLIDPSTVPKRKPPKDVDTWTTVAKGSYMICIDNLSKITPQISDALCRASTGDGDVQRELFTNGGLYVTSFRKVVVMNGIRVEGIQDDLADRLIRFKLPVISNENRLTETFIRSEWDELKPLILGNLLDIVSRTLAHLDQVQLNSRPRMADFAEILAAMDLALGTKAFSQYLQEVNASALDAVADDAVALAVGRRTVPEWSGHSRDLVDLLQEDTFSLITVSDWPNNARKMSAWLTRTAPTLRKAGWVVEDLGSANHKNTTRWKIIPPASFASYESPNSLSTVSENIDVVSVWQQKF